MNKGADSAVEADRFGKTGVLMGGVSAEREISLRSGAAVLQALLDAGVDAVGIDVGEDAVRQLQEQALDRVFVVLHGRGGEDGKVQALLELIGIPYTGSDVGASSLGMDKWRSKQLWQACGLPTPGSRLVRREQDLPDCEQLGWPLMVKPSHEGSSIGISIADNPAELKSAWATASRYDSEILVEEYVRGEEYTVAILGRQPLPVIRLETPRQFYDYQAKYEADDTLYHCPSGLSESEEQAVQQLAMQAFDAIGCCGWGRVDFMRDERGWWLIEVNTVPGMTDHSLVPMAARQAGIDFSQLTINILQQTL